MTPEEKIIYRYLDYALNVLETQFKNEKKDDLKPDEIVEYKQRKASIKQLKKQLKELKNGDNRKMD
jgi:hypothetical protein